MANLNVLKDSSEIIYYNNPNLPLYVKKGSLSHFSNMEMLCHWHEDIEYVKVTSGYMIYDVNGKKLHLNKGDAILINSRHMHYGYSSDGTPCTYYCIVFKPGILCNSDYIKKSYIDPITDNINIIYSLLNRNDPYHTTIINSFDHIYNIYQNKTFGYEFKAIGIINSIWIDWYELIQPKLSLIDSLGKGIDESIQRKMLEFIYQNYQSKISLQDIAKSGGVCRSRCCSIFQKYLGKTPITYLNIYRLETSMNLLHKTDSKITEIAYLCGFNSSSYYSETFIKYKGCTPVEYRNLQNNLKGGDNYI